MNAAPCIERGYVTFGSTHRIDKLTLRTLEVWSRVMNAVRGSRLLVFRNLLKGQPELQVSILERLADCGITPDRVDIAWDTGTEHLPAYHAIDILLDTVPWSAGTTAFESMWMGVPIPAMLGSLPTSRVAAAALDAVGLTEFIAESEDAYVASLEQLASDHAALAALRQTLRPRVEATVGDESGFVREWEATCRELVRR